MNIAPIGNTPFCAKFIGGKWYTDEEFAIAKKYRKTEAWEDEYRREFVRKRLKPDVSSFWLLGVSIKCILYCRKVQKVLDNEFPIALSRIRELMGQLNNNEILSERKKALKIAARTRQEQFNNEVLHILNNRFFKLLAAESEGKKIQIPTGIMVEKGSDQERARIAELIKEKSGCYFIETTHKKDDDATLYRIETELERAIDRYNSSGIRTILYIKNFSKMLKPEETSPATISRLKNIMSDMGVENSPLTIFFHTKDTTGILDAFLVNNTRIPLKIDLKEIKDAQRAKK